MLWPMGRSGPDPLEVGAVRCRYWTYMAAVMAGCLEKILREGRVEADTIPAGVFEEARRFMVSVQVTVQALVRNGPNPKSEDSWNFSYAAAAAGLEYEDEQKTDSILGELNQATIGLANPHALQSDEIEHLRRLKLFFRHLQDMGEADHDPVC